MTLLDCRADFADFGGVTYLDCAYQGPMPRVAIAALERAVELKQRPHRLTAEDYFSIPDAYRTAIGELIGCPADEIAISDSTTHGMVQLARGLDWRRDDEILIPRGEFPANRFPWLALQDKGVKVREIELSPGAAALSEIDAAIGQRTRLVSMAWVRYQTGERRDVAAVGRLCRDRGCLFAIDGSQGIGGLPFQLDQIPCDLVACSGYKWMLGPYGLGFVWISPALADRLEPPNVNWFAIEGARDFSRLGECRLAYERGARRFDINETANFFNLLSATGSLRFLLEIGVERAAAHVATLRQRLARNLPAPFRLLEVGDGATRSNICCLRADRTDQVLRAARRLEVLRVAVSRREGALRVSPFLYNHPGDIDRLLDGLARAADA